MPQERNATDPTGPAARQLYLGAAIALPMAVLIWTVLLGVIFYRL